MTKLCPSGTDPLWAAGIGAVPWVGRAGALLGLRWDQGVGFRNLEIQLDGEQTSSFSRSRESWFGTFQRVGGACDPCGGLGLVASLGFFGNVAAFLQFAWKWVLLSPGRLGKGGGSATKAGTVPEGVWGGLKGPRHPPTAVRQR